MMPTPVRLQLRDQREERVDLAIGERGGRFVHHDEARVRTSALAISMSCCWATESRRPDVERQRDAELAKHRGRRARRGGCVEETAAHRFDAEHDVLDHASSGTRLNSW